MAARPEDVQATFVATLVDEWSRRGVRHAVVAPGSRSTPMALALADHEEIDLHVHHDERSAAFMALGIGMADGRPAVLLTTSGTAAVELHAAVVEADLAAVPLLVCTADRPAELQGVGAPQEIGQDRLYGRSVRWFVAPGVAEVATRDRWRGLARRALAEATGDHPGPVHLNLAFREPLLGKAGRLPPAGPDAAGEDHRGGSTESVVALGRELVNQRGVFVAGAGAGPGLLLHTIAGRLGWPVVAAPQAEAWGVPGAVVPAADSVVRLPWLAEALHPEVVVRLGLPVASRLVGEWLAGTGAREIAVAGPGRWIDPYGTADVVVPVTTDAFLVALAAASEGRRPVAGGAWRALWTEAGRGAQAAIDAALADEAGPTEPGTVAEVVAALPDGAQLVVSSSMPVRDLEWYVRPRSGLRIHANRGANGIDGVVSTAVGVALATDDPTVLVIGDVAFLHDANGLLGLAGRDVDLVIVVIDNDGGGIFSFLPQATALEGGRFEALFGTPHGVDLLALASAHGIPATAVDGPIGVAVADALGTGGAHLLVVRTDRAENVVVHARLNAAVAGALGSAP